MKLIDALEIIKRYAVTGGAQKNVLLACGFTPAHLLTFFQAHLQKNHDEWKLNISTGLYGDLIGSVERASSQSIDACAVVLEWVDLDPRLGIRHLGGWSSDAFPDILMSVRAALERLQAALERLATRCTVALSVPTLPLPPMDLPAGSQAGEFELTLRQAIGDFSVKACRTAGLRILSPEKLNACSAHAGRFDVSTELTIGFPYKLAHADAVADLLARLLSDFPRKKGLITDLDDTCWKGILGEIGPESVCWSLAGNAQVHGIYQQFLQSLSKRGVLIGVASKNDPLAVAQAFSRNDMCLNQDSVYPVEVGWNPKSESVSRIIKAWNIGADSVVFVDDSPMEIAEVRTAFPQIECLLFPKDSPEQVLALLEALRDMFGKSVVLEEDGLRTQSLRTEAARSYAEKASSSYEEFLNASDATVTFQLATTGENIRAYELINKTNQFNLNGLRYNEAAWKKYFTRKEVFLLTASYRDKFGPLGEIAVVMGRRALDKSLLVDSWVMSCRAFSRRIEHQCLNFLFQQLEAESLVFELKRTAHNGPSCDFLASFGISTDAARLTRDAFVSMCPKLFHATKTEDRRPEREFLSE